uniref:Cytochrome P450 n=1 Tax=Strongyloides stercoralis TaxID=6248 RepID=A0AAF5DF06_STRER
EVRLTERERKFLLGEKIPGPKRIPIIGNANLFQGNIEDIVKRVEDEARIGLKNGDPLRRFWMGNDLVVHGLTSDARKVIFDSSVEIKKGFIYKFLAKWLGYGLITSDGDKWRERRKILTPTFHFNMLKKYFDSFNNESKVMIKHFEKYCDKNIETEVYQYAKRAALDIICDTAMGVKINAQDNTDNEYIKAVEKINALASVFFKNILYRFEPFYYLFGNGFERDQLLKILTNFTSNVIKEKTKEFEKNNGIMKDKTFLSHLLELKSENSLSDEDIREEVETFMFAGHDTTSSLNAFLWWSLACHPKIQDRVYEEIYDIFGDEERDVTPEDINKLKYTEMVIKETLRRFPTVPFIIRRLINEVEVCGYTVPKETNFCFPLIVANFNETIFPDPYKFDPDRFSPENIAKRNAYDFTPFSAGPRNCIGQKFALNEVKVVLCWMLRKYKLISKRPFDEVKGIAEVTYCPKEGPYIIFESRKSYLVRRIELGKKIPGPKGLPILGNILQLSGNIDNFVNFFQKQYDIGLENNDDMRSCWIGDKLLILPINIEVSQKIFESQTELCKGDTYDFLSDWLGYGLLISDGDKWRNKRKILTPTFNYNMLKKYFTVYNNESKILMNKFKPFAEGNEEVNVFEYAKRAVLDIICDTAMGVKINAQDNHDHEYIQAIRKFHKLNLKFVRMPFYKIKLIYYIFGDGFERDRVLKILHSFANDVIKQKSIEFNEKNQTDSGNTFLSMLLELKKENNWSYNDIFEEVNTFLFTGHDTSSSLLSFAWWELGLNLDIQEKLYNEIFDIFGEEDRDVVADDLGKLPYLDIFLRETLRRHAILPYFIRTLQEELEVCGKLLPKETNILFAPQHSNFNYKIFPDPYKFNPDRFLPENILKISQYDFTPFSAGPRNCIGQKFGMNQVKVMLIWTLRKYKLISKRPSDYVKHVPEIVQSPSNGIPLYLQFR